MTELNRRHVAAVVFLATAVSLAACGEGGGTPESVGIVEETAFYVRVVDEQKYPSYLHQTTGFDLKCEILAEQRDQDIVCYLEMNEGDIYFQPVKLQYNVPSKMCDYLEFRNYYYYNFEVGRGPSSIVIDKTVDAAGTVTDSTCTVDGDDCASPGLEAWVDIQAETAVCIYDLKQTVDVNLPNCCFGGYTKSVTTRSPGAVTTNLTRSKWGGDLVQCLSGSAATDDEWPKTSLGVPVPRIVQVSNTGLNTKYDIKPPIEISAYPGSFHTANFFTVGRHTHDGLVTTTPTSTFPYAMDPIDDVSGSDLRGEYFGMQTQDAYEWRCLDRGYEVINRLRLYIRDWNTQAELQTFGDTAGTGGNPDVLGREATQCNYNLPISDCNDLRDWDDIVTDQTTGSPLTYNGLGVNFRPIFFPSEPKAVSAPTQ